MKKLAVFTFILLSAFQLKAQDEAYVSELKNLMDMNSISSGMGAENCAAMFNMLFTQAKGQLPYKTDEERTNAATKYAKQYYDTQAKQDLSEIFAPYYAKHLTIEELRTITATLEQEKYKEAYQKLNGNEIQEFMQQKSAEMTMSVLGAIMQGKEPEPFIDASEKQSSHYLTFEKYMQQIGLNEAITNTFKSAMGNAGTEEEKAIMNKILSYIEKVIPEVLYLAYKEKATEEDLKTIIELYEKPEFKKMSLATNDITSDAMNMGMKYLQKISEWLGTQDLQ